MFIIIPLALLASLHPVVLYDAATGSSTVACIVSPYQTNRNPTPAVDLSPMSDPIQLAKEAAAQVNSPPRIYATAGNSISLWPERPGSVETFYGTGGIQPLGSDLGPGSTPVGGTMTLTTRVEPGARPGDHAVTFQSTWIGASGVQNHFWKFQIAANRHVTYLSETGDDLPPLPM
jgi:hypothetical protein